MASDIGPLAASRAVLIFDLLDWVWLFADPHYHAFDGTCFTHMQASFDILGMIILCGFLCGYGIAECRGCSLTASYDVPQGHGVPRMFGSLASDRRVKWSL
ncbi:hypothetical protein B0J13DRAFT_527643 [Dactylonectria estremocensis]|uniref:Uncharacterized protein n=1 Tax=Dactylonectria estremocensis TaxID=1079267 RepID=A0A9P9EI54_9HYPO|nr:hypothetical protein B0J13DRAFT_527643 [Dactylonectria estremocensis]